MELNTPKCYKRKCINFIGVKAISPEHHVVVCKAFPSGIPDSIAYGDDKHLVPVEGDGGIVFSKKKIKLSKKL